MPTRSYRLLSLAQLSVKLGYPYSVLYRLVSKGALHPDARSGAMFLFEERKLAQLRACVLRNISSVQARRLDAMCVDVHTSKGARACLDVQTRGRHSPL